MSWTHASKLIDKLYQLNLQRAKVFDYYFPKV